MQSYTCFIAYKRISGDHRTFCATAHRRLHRHMANKKGFGFLDGFRLLGDGVCGKSDLRPKDLDELSFHIANWTYVHVAATF